MDNFVIIVAIIFFVVGVIMVLVSLYKIHANDPLRLSAEPVDLSNENLLREPAVNPFWLVVGGIIFIVTAVFIYRIGGTLQ